LVRLFDKMETKDLKPGTIKHLQEYIAQKIKERGFEDETLRENLLLLSEEVGELIHACRKIADMNINLDKEHKHNVGEEVTDVINMIFAVGIKLGLDIEKEFLSKEEENGKRSYRRGNSC